MLTRAVLRIVFTAVLAFALFAVPEAARADTRVANTTDAADPGVLFDIQTVHVEVNRDAGTLRLDVSLYTALPATFPSLSGLSYLVAWINDADISSCLSGSKLGDTYINIAPSTSGALSATTNIQFRNNYATVPVSISSDRKSVNVSLTDPLLQQSNPRCVTVAGSGQATYDPSQPGGGSSYDSVPSFWFDGQAPVPTPAPTPTPTRVPASLPGLAPTPSPTPFVSTCGTPALQLRGDHQVAHGTTGTYTVSSTDSDSGYLGGARLEMVDAATGVPFYTHDFDSDDDANLLSDFSGLDDDDASDPIFFITLDPEFEPAKVVLRWNQKETYSSDPVSSCTASVDVASVRGSRPAFYVVGGGTGELIPRGHCATVHGKKVTITVSARGQRATFTRHNACDGFKGKARTVGAIHVGKSDVGSIVFSAAGRGSALVTAQVGGSIVLKRRVVSTIRSRPDKRIFEGTDAFVNYCINETKTLYSYRLRLYCIKPGSYHEAVHFS